MSIPSQISNQLPLSTNNALSLVTDPYHDYNLRATGFPDGQASISAVRRFTARSTISCPFVLTAGDQWFFHVYTTPLHANARLSSYVITGNRLITSDTESTSQYIGPVNVAYFLLRNNTVVQTIIKPLGPDVTTLVDRRTLRRTVSLGFEIHNTTAELYKSGSLTVYRAPSTNSSTDLWIKNSSDVGPTYYPYHVNNVASLPQNISAANLLPNSRTWDAAKGAYCVALPVPNNTFSNVLCSNLVLDVDGSQWGLHPAATDDLNRTLITYSPLACVGVYSSLYADNNQTFSVDMRQITELMPSPQDTVNLQFASTAPPCDREFLKLYAMMFNQIPPGTHVNKNASGDWFRSIIRIAKDVVPLIMGFIPHPAVKMSAVPVGQLLKVLDGRMSPDDKITNTQQQTSQQTQTTQKNKNKQNPKPKAKKSKSYAVKLPNGKLAKFKL